MAAKKKIETEAAAEQSDAPVASEEQVAAPAKGKKDATSAAVLNMHGAHIRTYSLADHGERFAELAKEFSGHTSGSSVVLS